MSSSLLDLLPDHDPSSTGGTRDTSGAHAHGPSADEVFEAFSLWAEGIGLTLYPAQEEAIIELVSGANVVLSTPTGTGKSLVAVAAHFHAMAHGKRSYYTAPIKALVSEKFFALVDIFGAENVGMVTGDSSVNSDAPIICCTAEILANLSLRHGADTPADLVVMDEFHFYADPSRGWAWQVPLLTLPNASFLLMSATLGEIDWLTEDLTRRTGRATASITGVSRPIPLEYRYALTPVHETVEKLLEDGLAPIYIVHFSQAAALERAQSMTSIKVASREHRDLIAAAIGGFRFSTAFGKTLSRLLRAGIGVHHAGMLPKYRRLVEQLAQQGLLRVICGTDTLGVGINVPIRTVLLTALTKFDGIKMRQLNAREFHQIAGRAGRAGYDTAGTVIAQAPEHETENAKLVARAGDDPKKLKKVVRKKAPEGFVSWGEPSFLRLVDAEPERLTSSMAVSHSMILNVIGREGDAFADMRDLIFDNHEPWRRQLQLARTALSIYRTLRTAEVVTQLPNPDPSGPGGEHPIIRLTVDLQPNFALNQPLSPFALAVFDLLQPAEDEERADTYALDMLSVVEATLDEPNAILGQQQFKARGEAVAEMKREGIEYEERMELLEEVTYPRPLDELLTESFGMYKASQPWVADFEIKPKSVVRDLYERAMTFSDFVNFYQLARSEGLVLRYLSDAYRAARQTIPDEFKTEELTDLIDWLGELVRQVDSSLLDEWEELINPSDDEDGVPRPAELRPPTQSLLTANTRAFKVLVRNELFRRVLLAAREDYDALGELDAASGFDADAWADALDPYFAEYEDDGQPGPTGGSGSGSGFIASAPAMGTGTSARSAALVKIVEEPGRWLVRQTFEDPEGDHDWGFDAEVDLAASNEQGEAVLRITAIGPLTS